MDTSWRNLREWNELVAPVDKDYHMDRDLEITHHRKFTMREFLSKLESNTFKIDEFDNLFPGKEFTQKERALG